MSRKLHFHPFSALKALVALQEHRLPSPLTTSRRYRISGPRARIRKNCASCCDPKPGLIGGQEPSRLRAVGSHICLATESSRDFEFASQIVNRARTITESRAHKPEHAKAESHAERAKHLTATPRSPFPLGSTRLEASIPPPSAFGYPPGSLAAREGSHSQGQHSFDLSLTSRKASFFVVACNAEPGSLASCEASHSR